MRPDLTFICPRCRVRLPEPVDQASCPFCMSMFEDGIKGADLDEQLKPRDLLEILAERIA